MPFNKMGFHGRYIRMASDYFSYGEEVNEKEIKLCEHLSVMGQDCGSDEGSAEYRESVRVFCKECDTIFRFNILIA